MAVHRKRRLAFRRRVAAVSVAIVLLLSVLITVNDGRYLPQIPSWHTLFAWFGFQEPTIPEGELCMTVLDVGNADCILLQSGEHSALIDAGENDDAEEILQALRLRNIKRLDYVIATHADADHIGSMDEVVRDVEIGSFLSPSSVWENREDTRACRELLTALEECRVETATAKYGTACAIGEATLTVISGWHGREYEDDNDSSVICRVTFGEHIFLLMADVSAAVERQLVKDGIAVDADVIKVSHHGSASSSDPTFIEEVSPEYAVITCGAGNSYGHPHERTLDTLEECGATVYRSDVNGDVSITSDGVQLSVVCER